MLVPFLLYAVALTNAPGQLEVLASLERKPEGGWELRLTSVQDGWIADPENLQLSLVAVGSNVVGKTPLIRFQKPDSLVQASNGQASLPVVVNRNGLPPTFVRLSASGFVIAPNGSGTQHFTVRATDRAAYLPIQMGSPGAAPGQRYFVLPGAKLELRSEDGAAIPPERSALRELRLETVDFITEDRMLATFKLEGWEGEVSLAAERDLSSVEGLAPIVWDPIVRRLRQKYLGKPMWVYGGTLAGLTPGGEWSMSVVGVTEPVRIRKIVRLYRTGVPMSFGVDPRLAGQSLTSFTTDHPLYALVDLPGGTGVVAVADEWHLERIFSPLSGFVQHPEWTAEQQQAVAQRSVSLGIDYAMAAWALGWPNEPGTKKEMMGWPRWRLEIGPSVVQTLHFKDGKVSRIE